MRRGEARWVPSLQGVPQPICTDSRPEQRSGRQGRAPQTGKPTGRPGPLAPSWFPGVPPRSGWRFRSTLFPVVSETSSRPRWVVSTRKLG